MRSRATMMRTGGRNAPAALAVLIAAMFAPSVQGAWYDPSDMSTMYQDNLGATTVTAVEQPVGLMLDKSKGAVRGAELVVTGDFSSSTGWSLGAGVTISSGVLSADASVVGTFATNSASVVAGKVYEVIFSVVSVAAAGGGVSIGTTVFSSAPTYSGSTPTTYRAILTASASGQIALVKRGGANWSGTIDNLSVREIAGNHLTQATTTSRPVLSSRINLLTKSEKFDDAAWTKGGAGTGSVPIVTADYAVAPDGTTTADRVQFAMNGGTTSADSSSVTGPSGLPAVVGGTYTSSVWAKTNDGTTKTMAFVGVGGVNVPAVVTPTWQRFSASGVAIATSVSSFRFRLRGTETTDDTADISLWGAQFQANGLTAYQWIDTATSYNAVGFPYYLKFDGVDDCLFTAANIDFTGTDMMTVVVAVKKLGDAADGSIVELASSNAVNGMFYIRGPGSSAATKFEYLSRGTSQAVPFTSSTTFIAPVTAVVTGTSIISKPTANMRINGASISTIATTQGTGNFSSNPLFVGRRNNASVPFSGNLYGLIIMGAFRTPDQVHVIERYLGDKSGVAL